jgi:hypothetical protein
LHSEGYTLLTRFPDDHRAVLHIVVMFSIFAHALRRSPKTPSSPIIGTNPRYEKTHAKQRAPRASGEGDERAITEAIVAMGKTLSMTVVAAGVATKEQRAYLRDLACDEMQGFYFSKPIAEAEFAAFLRKHLASSNK